MKTKETLKKEFEVFFQKHTNIRKLPFIMTVVIPKYECTGERHVTNCGELLEYVEHIDVDGDIDDMWEDFMDDLPKISDKDAFYQFDENTLVVVRYVDSKVVFQLIDYSDEIWDMY